MSRPCWWKTKSPALLLVATLGLAVFATSGMAQRPSRSSAETAGKSIPSGIAWYGVLSDGLAEAKATNRPIMLLSAAPQCAGVPGMW